MEDNMTLQETFEQWHNHKLAEWNTLSEMLKGHPEELLRPWTAEQLELAKAPLRLPTLWYWFEQQTLTHRKRSTVVTPSNLGLVDKRLRDVTVIKGRKGSGMSLFALAQAWQLKKHFGKKVVSNYNPKPFWGMYDNSRFP